MKVCAFCSDEIKTKYPSQAKTRKYCSVGCADIANAKKRQKRVTLACLICSKLFTIKQSHAHLRKTCSLDCAGEHKSQTNVGPAHWAWKPVKKVPAVYLYKRVRFNGIYQYEHRFVMEKHLGRKLKRNEHVHHLNGDPTDNRLENLQIISPREHMLLHHRQKDIFLN